MTQVKTFFVIKSNVDGSFYAMGWDKYSPWAENLELADKYHSRAASLLAVTRDGIDMDTVDIVPVRVTYEVLSEDP